MQLTPPSLSSFHPALFLLLLNLSCPPPPLYPTFPLTSLALSPLPVFMKCAGCLAGSCWLASGGGYSFIIPPRLLTRLATMSQELNICHYYLLVLFDFEAAQ